METSSLWIALVILASLNLAGLSLVGYWTHQTQWLLKELIKYARTARGRK